MSNSTTLAKKRAIKWFNRFIRLRDVDENGLGRCCSCRKFTHFRGADAGHYVSCKQEATRFDEENVHFQCQSCNRFQEGNKPDHAEHITNLYGPKKTDELLFKSRIACIRKRYDFEVIADHYRERCKQLEKIKNVK